MLDARLNPLRHLLLSVAALLALAACGDDPSGSTPEADGSGDPADVVQDTGESDAGSDAGQDVPDPDAAPDASPDAAPDTDDAGPDSVEDTGDDTFFDPDVAEDTGTDAPVGRVFITGIDPARGPVDGQTGVFIFGSGFTVDTQVLINGRAFEEIDVIDNETILARTPSNPPGTYDVKVVSGRAQDVLEGGFTYFEELEAERIEPATGPERGGVPVSVYGDGFTPTTQVSVGGRLGIDLRVVNDTRIDFVLPPGAEGAADVRVTNENGTSVLDGAFDYYAEPEIVSFLPAAGPADADTFSELVARGLTGEDDVRVGPSLVGSDLIAESTLRVRVRGGTPGFADVALTNELGGDVLVDGFYFVADADGPLAVERVVPDVGSSAGGYLVTVAGPGVGDATEVRFGDDTARIDDAFAGAVVVEVPASATSGAVDVTVVTADGEATLADGFEFLPALSVDEVEPNTGESVGGETVTIRGAGFTDAARVRFGPIVASSVTRISETELQVVTPPGSVGAVDVTVDDAGRVAVLEDGFTYLDDAEVYSVSPTRGAIAGNTWVVIRGRGFFGDVRVFFDEEEATEVTVVDAATLEVRTPRVEEPTTATIRLEVGGEDVPVRDRFVFYDPYSPAGGWWGEAIDGSVNVTVVDAADGSRFENAFVTTSLRADGGVGVSYSGYTNDNGQVTLSGPGLTGVQTVSASARGYSSATITSVNAENIVIFLAEAVPPSSGGGGGEPPPTFEGTITGLDKIVNPAEGESIVAVIRTTTPGVGQSNPPGTGITQVTWEGGDDPIPYVLPSRYGELAVTALCGLLNETTGEFRPLYMDVQRGFAVRSNLEPIIANLDCRIPLDVTMTFKFVNPPLGSGGIQTLQAIPYLDFGNEGATDFLQAAEGTNDVISQDNFVSLSQPGLEGVNYDITAQAVPLGGGLPFSTVYARDILDPTQRITLQPFLPPAELEYPAPNGTLVERRFEWSLSTDERPDFYYAYISNMAQDVTYWEVWLPGDEAGFNLPYFPPGSDVGPFPEGENLILIVLSIKAYTFDYDNWEFNDFGAQNWRSYSAGGWVFFNPAE